MWSEGYEVRLYFTCAGRGSHEYALPSSGDAAVLTTQTYVWHHHPPDWRLTSTGDQMYLPERTADIESAADSAVSGCYGPGALPSWVLILCSVLVSWTLNPNTRNEDIMTNDFLAALTMPIVAAAHIFYLLQHHLDTTAPFHVCWTFNSLAWILLLVSGVQQHRKRLLLVAHVGSLCLLAEYLSNNGAHTSWIANLLEFTCPMIALSVDLYLLYRQIPDSFQTLDVRLLPEIVQIVLSFSACASAYFANFVMAKYATILLSIYRIGALSFRPLTTTSITDLDQASALAVGLVTLVFNLWEAWHSRGSLARKSE